MRTLLTLIATTAVASPVWANAQLRVTNNFRDIGALQGTLNTLTSGSIDIDDMATGPNGEWVIVAGTAVYRSTGVPAALVSTVQGYIQMGRQIDALAIGPNGSWVVAADDLFYRGPNVSQGQALNTYVKGRQNSGHQIDEIALTPSGGFVVLSEGNYYGLNVPTNLWAAIKDTDKSKRRPRRISIGADGRWMLLAEQWHAGEALSTSQVSSLKGWQRAERSIDHMMLGVGSDFIMYSHSNAVLKPAMPMRAMEYSLIDDIGVTNSIWERMDELNVAGVSVAVIDGGQIKWARGYGELEGNSQRFVRASTPYSIASMSKYLTALATMRLVEDGTLALTNDARIMADQGRPTLDGWRDAGPNLYGSSLPFGITLRRLLSHTSGMNDNNQGTGWGGMLGATEVPTSWILRGWGCSSPNNCGFANRTLWPDPTFGTPAVANMNYSNSGYEVVRAMIEDTRGEPFADVMQQEVFDVLGMTNTTYDVLDSSFDSRSAPGLDGNKNPVARQTYQWYAGGGVYATPEDYAKAMRVLINLDGSFLNATSTSEILKDQKTTDNPLYGFGVYTDQAQVTKASGRFVHGGFIPGYSWTRMFGVPSAGRGIVIMTNDTSLGARKLVCEIENAFRTDTGVPTNGC